MLSIAVKQPEPELQLKSLSLLRPPASLPTASAGTCAIRWWEIRDAIWPTPPMLFFPRLVLQFTTHAHTGTREAAETHGWDLPFWRQPTHRLAYSNRETVSLTMLARTFPQTQLSLQKVALPQWLFPFEYGVKEALCCGAEEEAPPRSSADKPPSILQCGSTASNKRTPSDSSSDPAAAILILIFIHSPISISYTFSFQDINQARSLWFSPLLAFMLLSRQESFASSCYSSINSPTNSFERRVRC